MDAFGLTRARSMGPVMQAVEAAGGSVARVFRDAGLRLSLMDAPDRPMLLRDQIRLVARAAREVGDDALPARLSMRTGIRGLGPLGWHVGAAATLREAIGRAHRLTPSLLQTATWTGLEAVGAQAFYGYAVQERIEAGRQTNEILALGYLLGVARHFLGPHWRPERAVVTGATLPARAEIEAVFGCEIALGRRAGLLFVPELLDRPNPDPVAWPDAAHPAPLPASDDLAGCIAELIGDDHRSLDGICRALGLSRRTLQRRLEAEGLTYAEIRHRVRLSRAKDLLEAGNLPIGEIAHRLGYADPAHFSRAFRGAAGVAPRAWRRARRPT